MSESVYIVLPMMVLLPLIPAYILFKVLKSQGSVSTPGGAGGPLLGFRIQLGGAFAGYFALLLLLLYAFNRSVNPAPTQMVWKLRGQVLDDQHNPLPVTNDSFVLIPQQRPLIATDPAGGFFLNFIQDPTDDTPTVSVSYGDFLPKQVKLDQEGMKWDEAHHTISLPPITLSRADASKIRTSQAAPIDGQGAVTEYEKFGHASAAAPPPGYAGGGLSGGNQ